MPSNYFTRPKGLHPTPSACYPPPPPPAKNAIRTSIQFNEQPYTPASQIAGDVYGYNPLVTLGSLLTIELTLPPTIEPQHINGQNGQQNGFTDPPGRPPGHYIATAKLTWIDGITRTIHQPFIIHP